MDKKYKLTDDVKEINGVVLYRIVALRDFGSIKSGEKGGWIEREENLSHNGDAWVYGDARVYGDAEIKHTSDYIVFKNFWRPSDTLHTRFQTIDGK